MTIREFCKSINFEIKGKLIRIPSYHEKMWRDEAGNEYYKDRENRFYIITADGGVI